MKRLFVIVLSASVLLGCLADGISTSQVNIRLSNVSEFDFKNIEVDTGFGRAGFEDIDAGQSTEYKRFIKAYRYAYIQLEIDGETYTIQPFDYVGETPLKNGYYTYQIDANNSKERYGKLMLTLIEDLQ
ncbi:MAG: hypothetical protein JXQ96_08705 [Cyclobacteriaceae bacterium]